MHSLYSLNSAQKKLVMVSYILFIVFEDYLLK